MDALSFRPLPSCPLVGGYSRAAPVSMGTRSHRWCHYSPRQARSPEAADAESPAQTEPDALISSNPYLVPSPHLRLWPATQVGDDGERESLRGKSSGEEEEKEGTLEVSAEPVRRRGRGRWFVMILRIRSLFQGQREDGDDGQEGVQDREDAAVSRLLEESDCRAGCCDEEWSEGCHVCGEEEDLRQQQGDQEGWEAIEVNRDSFSTLLRRASMADAKLYEKLSYLGSLAYAIPRINHTSLLKVHGLRFVTSSLEKKLKPADAEAHGGAAGEPKVEVPVEQPVKAKKKQEKQEGKKQEEQEGKKQEQQEGNKQEHQEGSTPFTASDAYRIATAAASYIHNQTKSIIPFQDATGGNQGSSPTKRDDSGRVADEASFVVTTESVTAVVAAKEEVKAAVASDLNSSRTSPCEWFICDDEKTGTRLFVIQGSESLASWQANLLFEPVQFEGLDVVVHRGIYEAAKGMYQQMLPHIQSHLKTRGPSATLRFTGHSLGGSLSLLINLMLLVRGQAPHSTLLPVITFGAPSIMCGGDYLLRKLGLPQSHIQAITMHRDIVPRAFSCTYPDRVAEILKALNGSFRKHPCLNQQKLLYAPMGELLILQPGDKFSPGHHLLPSGSGLYFFGQSLSPDSADATRTRRLLRAALSVFLNSPHPLEILGDRSAYGADGAVARDHDMGSYLKAMREVIQVEKQRSREAEKTKRQQQHQLRMLRWPLVGPYVSGARRRRGASGEPFRQIDISNVVNGGMESFRRITKMVDSQNMHLLVMAMLPALGIAQNA